MTLPFTGWGRDRARASIIPTSRSFAKLRMTRYPQDDKGRSLVKRAIQEEKWMYSNCQNAKPRMKSWHEGQQKGLTLKALPCFPFLSALGIL
jgi:hypothetical protein